MLEVYERNGVICAEGLIEAIGQKVFLYLVDGMLIDCGPEILKDELLPFFQKHAFEQVILTHNHEDHTGNAAWIQNNMDKPIYIHPAGLAVCLVDGEYPAYRQFTWGGRKAFVPGIMKTEVVSNTLEWKTLYTPGHADDHIALYNQDRKTHVYRGFICLFENQSQYENGVDSTNNGVDPVGASTRFRSNLLQPCWVS